MILIVLSYLLLILASICNSIMDVTKFHWHKSIFCKPELQEKVVFGRKLFKRQWWDGTISWRNKYVDGDFNKSFKTINIFGKKITKPVQLTDSFHWFKMWMVIFLCGSITLAMFSTEELNTYLTVPMFFLYGTTWNVVFSFFYNKVLKI